MTTAVALAEISENTISTRHCCDDHVLRVRCSKHRLISFVGALLHPLLFAIHERIGLMAPFFSKPISGERDIRISGDVACSSSCDGCDLGR